MRFNSHSELAGLHAFLSASKYHWVNYSDEKLDRAFLSNQAARRGDQLHQLARDLITMGVKLPRTKTTMNLYVNDAIGFRMTPEQVLYYSMNSFGTADTISFRENKLRISDLKTGITPCSMRQLEVYVALFCLEYQVKPHEIEIELRIYQNDEVQLSIPDPETILHIMDRIITFDKRINAIREETL